MKVYRKIMAIASSIIMLLSICVVASAATLTMDSNFQIQVTGSFRIPLVESYEIYDTEIGVDPPVKKTVRVYRDDIPIVGKFSYPEAENPSNSYHYVTGSSAFNITFTMTQGKTGEDKITFTPVVSENIVTAYNGYTTGQNSNVCRTLAFFSSYSTYGQPYVNLGTYTYEHVVIADTGIASEEYIIVQPTLTKITQALYYPTSADPYTNIAGQIISALNASVPITDIASVLHSIYSQDTIFFANVLTYIDQLETNQSEIIRLLDGIKAQDLAFYADVRQYLTAKQEEASEAVQEATRVQEQASEMASELAQTKPDLSLAMEQVEHIGQVQGQQGKQLFFWITGPILSILIMAIVIGTLSYILFGKKG